jgi:hypothetical protein
MRRLEALNRGRGEGEERVEEEERVEKEGGKGARVGQGRNGRLW